MCGRGCCAIAISDGAGECLDDALHMFVRNDNKSGLDSQVAAGRAGVRDRGSSGCRCADEAAVLLPYRMELVSVWTMHYICLYGMMTNLAWIRRWLQLE